MALIKGMAQMVGIMVITYIAVGIGHDLLTGKSVRMPALPHEPDIWITGGMVAFFSSINAVKRA